MMDPIFTCSRCGTRPATLRLNEFVICPACALVVVQTLVEAPKVPRMTALHYDEGKVIRRILACPGKPWCLVRDTVELSWDRATAACERLLAFDAIERDPTNPAVFRITGRSAGSPLVVSTSHAAVAI